MKTLTLLLLLPLLGACRPRAETAAEKSQAGQTNRPATVSIRLGTENVENGIQMRGFKDGNTAPVNIGGSDCRSIVRSQEGQSKHFYFALDESFKSKELMDVLVVLDYFDGDPGSFFLQYDGTGQKADEDEYSVVRIVRRAAYAKAAPDNERVTGTQTWRKAYFICRNAEFKNSQNGGGDFRVVVTTGSLFIRRVTVLRLDEMTSNHQPDSL